MLCCIIVHRARTGLGGWCVVFYHSSQNTHWAGWMVCCVVSWFTGYALGWEDGVLCCTIVHRVHAGPGRRHAVLYHSSQDMHWIKLLRIFLPHNLHGTFQSCESQPVGQQREVPVGFFISCNQDVWCRQSKVLPCSSHRQPR